MNPIDHCLEVTSYHVYLFLSKRMVFSAVWLEEGRMELVLVTVVSGGLSRARKILPLPSLRVSWRYPPQGQSREP